MLWLSPRIQQLPAAIPFSTIQRIPDIFLLYMHKYIYSHINTHIYLSIYTDFHTTLWSLNCMHVYTYIFSVTRPLLSSSLSLSSVYIHLRSKCISTFRTYIHTYMSCIHVPLPTSAHTSVATAFNLRYISHYTCIDKRMIHMYICCCYIPVILSVSLLPMVRS